MEVKAKAKYIRMSPRKIRLVIDVIRGMDVLSALNQLKFIAKAAAKPIIKLLNSAIANGENNYQLERSNLYIKDIRSDEGPVLKRWMPRAFGRAAPLKKRSTHISLVLEELVPSKGREKKEQTKEEIKIVSPKEAKELEKKKIKEAGIKEKKESKGFSKKMFSRKSF